MQYEPDYQPPVQSPYWDDVMPLAQMLSEAKYFVLTKQRPHGDLVEVVLQEFDRDGQPWLQTCTLSHDCCGVTCESSGSLGASMITYWMERGQAELTQNPAAVLRYIWEVMNCHPNMDRPFPKTLALV